MRRRFRIELDTPRLRLRPLVDEDVEWLAPIWADREVNRYLWDPELTGEEAREAAEVMVDLDSFSCHFGKWAIQNRTTGQYHGWVELGKLRPWWGPSDEIALSYVLARDSWGRGIATEAGGRLLQYAFEMHRLPRVMAVVIGENTASKRVLEKLGMSLIKTADSHDGRQLEFYSGEDPCCREF